MTTYYTQQQHKTTLLENLTNVFRRPPDVIINRMIGNTNVPYLQRWYLIPKNRFLNIYLHYFMRSDEDAALHNHPWPSLGILLTGGYKEHVFDKKKGIPHTKVIHREKGSIIFRSASLAHRIELYKDYNNKQSYHVPEKAVWTLFITGPKHTEWGFLPDGKFVHWKEFLGVQ